MGSVWKREAGLWAGAAVTGLGGGLAYKQWATKNYGGAAKDLLAEAKELRATAQPALAAWKFRECLDLVEAHGGAYQRQTAHTAMLAQAVATTLEEAAEAEAPGSRRRAEYLADSEAHWQKAVDAAPPRHELRAVALDRLASYAQERGDLSRAGSLYSQAVRTLASPEEIDKGAESLRGNAMELAGIMHNFATCIYEESGDRHKAYLVLDQTNKVCGVVEDAARRADCEARVQELRAHLARTHARKAS